MATLVITNGDHAADLLVEAGRGDTVLAWRDVLHEGPLADLPLGELTSLRVRWLAQRFGLDRETIAEDFAERDEELRRHLEYDRIELWFEHDLFDQLQLVQLLNFFSGQKRPDRVCLVQADSFLGAERPQTILRFAERERPITSDDLDTAAPAWRALCAASPAATEDVIRGPGDTLPYLKPALIRFLEELPDSRNGLSRTEEAALSAIARGIQTPTDIFREVLGHEEAAFMGDWSFFHLLETLANCEAPLISGLLPSGDDFSESFRNSRIMLTSAGTRVLAQECDHVSLSGIDRWWAGTHLNGRFTWRYDRATRTLISPDEAAL